MVLWCLSCNSRILETLKLATLKTFWSLATFYHSWKAAQQGRARVLKHYIVTTQSTELKQSSHVGIQVWFSAKLLLSLPKKKFHVISCAYEKTKANSDSKFWISIFFYFQDEACTLFFVGSFGSNGVLISHTILIFCTHSRIGSGGWCPGQPRALPVQHREQAARQTLLILRSAHRICQDFKHMPNTS